ncbi:DUF4199 family protein [Chitinophaga sp. SYP-B3965]|uniref:DUF4199 domain-containing protein n=1 Tax=Chitinophaga sp. SYP-B3965 TaxID=2663120 RepID=UPI001299A3C3|nr:DUF4199 domain-containing protein [Chitinophaga sp. SYP-B3965]MRG43821.1 DUF4199 family protein [Chitinophaga sp. SYP-B3965]
MKKNILVSGLIGGAFLSIVLVYSISLCYSRENFEGNMVLGFASMFLAFSLIFIAVKNFRDKHNGGVVTFGKAFMIGLYISLIASSMYVLTWVIDYYLFVPDFMEKFVAHNIQQVTAKGGSAAEIAEKAKEMNWYADMYKSPIMLVLLTYMEVFPIGLLISLISALILRKKKKVLVTN